MVKDGGSNLSVQTATIQEAYDQLSQEAFAVWIRLMVASDLELKAGRNRLAKLLGYSEGRSNVILRELKNKGYVTLHRSGEGPGMPTHVRLERRAVIAGRTHFVRLSRVLGVDPAGHGSESQFLILQSHANSSENLLDPSNSEGALGGVLAQATKNHVKGNPLPFVNKPQSGLANLASGGGGKPSSPQPKVKMKEVAPNISGGAKAAQRAPESISAEPDDDEQDAAAWGARAKKGGGDGNGSALYSPTDPLRMKLSKQKEQLKRKEQREEARAAREHAQENVNWTKLDKTGKPAITFSPTEEQRARMISILDSGGNNPDKKRLLAKLGSEVQRIYSTYRRLIHRSYSPPPREKKYARQIADLCIRLGVTPQVAIQYWHEHIHEFTDLKFPPLSFLAAPANIETVSCVDFERKTKPKARGRTETPEPVRHSFSDPNQLDKRLRSGLESAGIDTGDWTDRHLLTVQKTAITVAKGTHIFMSPKMRTMVEWAVEHLYSDLKGK